MRTFLCLILSLAIAGCAAPAKLPAKLPAEPKIPAKDPKLVALEEAQAALAKDPGNEELLIWVGRRLAYLGRFQEAQAQYTQGLGLHPKSYKLMRHRGHRWITLRRFDIAVADLTRAEELMQGQPDEIEPDGMPNPAGIPIGTYRSNITYHLALAHFLRGEYAQACAAWERGGGTNSANPDRLVSSTYWHALALFRLNRDSEALALLGKVQPDLKLLENESYHDLCLLFAGKRKPQALLEGIAPGTSEHATRGFGVSAWYRLYGKSAEAEALVREIVERDPENSFGRIAAEVDQKCAAGQ